VEYATEDGAAEESIRDDEHEQDHRPARLEKEPDPVIPRGIKRTKEHFRSVERRDGDKVEQQQNEINLKQKRESKNKEVVRWQETVALDRRDHGARERDTDEVRERPSERNECRAPSRKSEPTRIKRHRSPPPETNKEEREKSYRVDMRERIHGEPTRITRGLIAERRPGRRMRELVNREREENRDDPGQAERRLLKNEVKRHCRLTIYDVRFTIATPLMRASLYYKSAIGNLQL
jgi:hypothetical protein